MKKTVGMILVLLLTLVGVSALADVAINEANFPDANFREYVLEAGFDTDKNGVLSSSELANVTEIRCENKSISSVKGIEHFTNLKKIFCGNNNLTSLDVSQNTVLDFLACNFNKLTALDVGNNPSLTALYCQGNQLTTLDVSKNIALDLLSCYENQLKFLDVSKNTALELLG